MNFQCSHCHALHFISEKLSKSSINQPKFWMCCLSGQVQLPPLSQAPRELADLSECYVLYHRSNSISVSAWDAPQMHSWSSNITSCMLPVSIRTIPILAWVLQHPTTCKITLTLSLALHLSMDSVQHMYTHPRSRIMVTHRADTICSVFLVIHLSHHSTCYFLLFHMSFINLCYVPYHRSNSVSISAWDTPQTHSWSSNITSHTLPFSIRTIPVLAQVLWHPIISKITITLSFSTSLVNGLRPTHASLFGISDYGYAQSRYHMIQFTSPHVYFISPYARFILPCSSLYLIFLLPCAHCHITNVFSFYYLNIEYLSCHSQFWIST